MQVHPCGTAVTYNPQTAVGAPGGNRKTESTEGALGELDAACVAQRGVASGAVGPPLAPERCARCGAGCVSTALARTLPLPSSLAALLLRAHR